MHPEYHGTPFHERHEPQPIRRKPSLHCHSLRSVGSNFLFFAEKYRVPVPPMGIPFAVENNSPIFYSRHFHFVATANYFVQTLVHNYKCSSSLGFASVKIRSGVQAPCKQYQGSSVKWKEISPVSKRQIWSAKCVNVRIFLVQIIQDRSHKTIGTKMKAPHSISLGEPEQPFPSAGEAPGDRCGLPSEKEVPFLFVCGRPSAAKSALCAERFRKQLP